MIGKYVVVRCDKSGIYAGVLKEVNDHEVTLTDCRNLWYWEGAASVLQIAKEGVKNPDSCKFTVAVDEIHLLDAISIIPCTEKAEKIIRNVAEWKK